jgi:hypothetical protein
MSRAGYHTVVYRFKNLLHRPIIHGSSSNAATTFQQLSRNYERDVLGELGKFSSGAAPRYRAKYQGAWLGRL